MNAKYKVASLFSGCGGFDLGFVGGFRHLDKEFEKLPFRIVFANDIDKDAVSVYRENGNLLGHRDIIHDDIRNIDPIDVRDFDVLMAGFPCQPFSTAGKRKGVEDERGTLYQEVIRFVKAKRPKIIVLENVRGILSSKMPDGETVANTIVKKLSKVENGIYDVSEPMLIRASELGVPQNRYRVIITAVRKDIGRAPSKLDVIANAHKFKPEDLILKKVLFYGLSKDLPNSKDVWDLSPQAKKLVPYIKKSWKDVPYELLPDRMKKIKDNIKKYRSPNFYRRFSLDEINGTITASAQPENCGILHPLENRRYSVREIARIQSFPDNFTFNSISSIPGKYKVIGNAVPPVMAHAIAKTCLNILENGRCDKKPETLLDFPEIV